METRNVLAEIFINIPGHIWVIPVACALTFFALMAAEKSLFHGDKIKLVMYIGLIALAVIPSGYLSVFPPAANVPVFSEHNGPLPNYMGRFYLDAFLVFVGWVAGSFGHSKL